MANFKLRTNSSQPNKPATASSDIRNIKYPLYEWNNIFMSQLGKEFGKKKRMTLTCNGFTFQAKIDPNNYNNSQQKRNIQIPVINGIIIQDFGYEAEKIELKGSAGMDFYQKIQEADAVFNNQSNSGSPTPATLTFENRVYTCFIDSFNSRISAVEATYEYIINLTVLQRSGLYNNVPQNNSSIANSNKIKNASTSLSGTNVVQYISYTGKTPKDYVSNNSSIAKNQQNNALQYISSNWSTAYQNTRPYPGDNSPLLNTEVLVVPNNWSDVLNSSGFISQGSLTSQISGDPTATA